MKNIYFAILMLLGAVNNIIAMDNFSTAATTVGEKLTFPSGMEEEAAREMLLSNQGVKNLDLQGWSSLLPYFIQLLEAGGYRHLEIINLSRTNISIADLYKVIRLCKNLQEINVSQCANSVAGISAALKDYYGFKLKKIDISYADCSRDDLFDCVYKMCSTFSSLRELNLTGCAEEGAAGIIVALGTLREYNEKNYVMLTSLTLSITNRNNLLHGVLEACPFLERLNLSGSQGCFDDLMVALSDGFCQQLKEIILINSDFKEHEIELIRPLLLAGAEIVTKAYIL